MSFLLLGSFFCVLAVLVLIGSYWALGRPHAMIVNIAAGVMMLLVGGGMIVMGQRMRRPPATSTPVDGVQRP